jgi:hypothetical protein
LEKGGLFLIFLFQQTSSTIFTHFQHKQNAKEILRKKLLEPKLQLIENKWPF